MAKSIKVSRKVRLLGWTLVAALPVALLAGAEACARLLDLSPSFQREASIPAWLDRNILVKDAKWMKVLDEAPRDLGNFYGTYLWDRYLFYRLKPGVEVALTDPLAPPSIRPRTRWVLRTNSRGYPGRDVEPGPHAGTYRILALGDSSTFGWGVESRDSYPAVLERELRRRHPGRSIEVANLGICGYSSFQGKVLLEREGLEYQPDLVTLSYGSNDWSRVPEPFDRAFRRNAGWIGGIRALLHRSRAYGIYAAFLTRLVEGDWSDRVQKAQQEAGGEMPLNVGPEKSETNIREMIGIVRRSGADPLVVTNCVRGQMAAPVLAAARKEGVPLVHAAELLEDWIPRLPAEERLAGERARVLGAYGEDQVARYSELEVYLADGCHPNVVGHRLLAEELADRVEASPSFRRFLER